MARVTRAEREMEQLLQLAGLRDDLRKLTTERDQLRAEAAEGRADGLYRGLCDAVRASGGVANDGISDTFLIIGVPAEMAARKKAQEAAERERDEARAQVADLRVALEECRGCVEAAQIEGMTERLVEADIHEAGSLAGLVSRRLLHVYPIADAAISRTPAQSLGRIKAKALREFAKSRDVEVIGNGDWYGGIQAERTATVDDLRETADRLEKEATDGR